MVAPQPSHARKRRPPTQVNTCTLQTALHSIQCKSAQSTCCTKWQKCEIQMGKTCFPWYMWTRNAIHLKEVSNLYNSKMSNKFDFFYQVFVDFCLIISLLPHQSVRPFPTERRVSAPWDLAVLKSATWRQLGDNMGQVWDNLGLVWDYLGLVWDYLRLFSEYIGAKKSQCTNHLEIYRAQSRQHLSFERHIFFRLCQYSVFRWWVPADMPTTVAFGVKVFQFV